MKIRELNDRSRGWVDRYIRDEWGGPMLATLGNLFDSSNLPGFIALDGDQPMGAILYRMDQGECEIAALFSLIQGRGAGAALMDAVINAAKTAGCHRVFLITTNDNTHAIRFYQKYGLSLKAVHIGSIEITRKLKPGLPARGIDGIPIEHEFEFEMIL